LTIDSLNTDLFAPVGAEAAFGSCAHSEDLFLDIGDQNPHCVAGNDGSPLGIFNYTWNVAGDSLAQFIGDDSLLFDARMTGDAFGHCDDDDVGDYCRLQLAMNWHWYLGLTYTFETAVIDPESPDPGPGGPGNPPTSVPEPGSLGLMSIALFGLVARIRRRGMTSVSREI
jgi:hypothetical protein